MEGADADAKEPGRALAVLVAAGQRGADGDALCLGDGGVEGDVVVAVGGFGDELRAAGRPHGWSVPRR